MPLRSELRQHPLGERAARARHLRAAGLGGEDRLVVGERALVGLVGVADRGAVAVEVGEQRLGKVEPGDPQRAQVGRHERRGRAAGQRERLGASRGCGGRRCGPRRPSACRRRGRGWRGAGRRSCRRSCARATPPEAWPTHSRSAGRPRAGGWGGRGSPRGRAGGRSRRPSSAPRRGRAAGRSPPGPWGGRTGARSYGRSGERARLVAPGRQVALDQRQQAGDARLRRAGGRRCPRRGTPPGACGCSCRRGRRRRSCRSWCSTARIAVRWSSAALADPYPPQPS